MVGGGFDSRALPADQYKDVMLPMTILRRLDCVLEPTKDKVLERLKKLEGGTRLAIVFNGSPLFTGSAGSGESEIRRWIIENDWLGEIESDLKKIEKEIADMLVDLPAPSKARRYC